MRPGNDCRSCHSFSVSGTVYPSAHEPTNCNGTAAGGIKVVITGADGAILTLVPNSTSGNFYSSSALKTPFSAKLTNSAGASRAMVSMQTAGNCNSCHTQNGTNSAPGRIMAP
jgi:nitrate/TMAO reductase-like tetraheme cytochrome c subunit